MRTYDGDYYSSEPHTGLVISLQGKLLWTHLWLHRGMKGVAFTHALDKRAVCPSLPEYGTPEYDSGPLDRLHATIPALLSSVAIQELPQTAEAVSAAQLVRCVFGWSLDSC